MAAMITWVLERIDVIWYGIAIGLVLWTVWRARGKNQYEGSTQEETERLLKDQLPPMHGVKRKPDGTYERY